MQNKTFDPGGSQSRLRGCPFLGSWHVLLCGEVMHGGAAGAELQRFSEEESGTVFAPYVLRSIVFLQYGAFKNVLPSRVARGYTS